jgi:ribulose-5-phosphate 4-epimerase/fuculose-1-phosphate aldolase
MVGHSVRDDLAMACRVLARHRLMDLWGHASLRIPRSDAILVTPRFGKNCLPRNIRGGDLIVVDLDGTVIEGSGQLPLQFAADLALYRKNREIGACIFASPTIAMAAGIARYKLQPLTHMESEIAYGLAFWDSNTLANDPHCAEGLAGILEHAAAVQQPGIGAWTRGKDIIAALMDMYHLEYLAQANLVASTLPIVNRCEKSDSEKIWRQFAGYDHYIGFFQSLDPGPLPHPAEALEIDSAPAADAERVKSAVALSCQALWERDTLVAFLEHISHRLPGTDRFLISPAKNFQRMRAEDMCVLDYNANWIDGPKPPGFKFFHAQLMRERSDVQAIVHTHDLYGRMYALSRQELLPIFRTGLDIAMRPMPTYPRCDLVVDADVRRATIDALGTGPIVHEACHGTDFVAPTLEQALVDAIHRETFLAMDHTARRFGTPVAMSTDVQEVRGSEPSAEDWWWFYTAEIGAPRRSVAGL